MMIVYQLVSTFAIGFLAFAISDAKIDCYPGYALRPTECQAALNSIIFESDGTLEPVSKHVGTIWGGCSIIVLNPHGARIAKQQILTTLSKILDQCTPSAGGAPLPPGKGTFLNIGGRSDAPYVPYEWDFPANVVKCGLIPDQPGVLGDDCRKAYDSLETNQARRFTEKSLKIVDSAKAAYGSCTVNVFTSDGSGLVVTKDKLAPQLSKVLNQCKNKDGVVHIQGGAAGKNGRTYVKVRSSIIP